METSSVTLHFCTTGCQSNYWARTALKETEVRNDPYDVQEKKTWHEEEMWLPADRQLRGKNTYKVSR